MTAVRRTSVLVLAVLLTAATAVADTVITADEVGSGLVVSADTNLVRLKIPQGGIRVLYTRDVFELRLTDSSRVADLAIRLPQLRVVLDSSQPIPPPEARAEQLRQERILEDRAKGLWYPHGMDTLTANAPKHELVARCRELRTALLDFGRSDDTVARLRREVHFEVAALRGIGPRPATYLYAPAGCLLGMAGGAVVGALIDRPRFSYVEEDYGGCAPGCLAGGAAGLLAGVSLVITSREGWLAEHRSRVNDLIRRFNRAIASPP